jgi:predicted GTPase
MPNENARQGPRRRRVLIAGAAGRDFHDFNVVFRDDPDTEVVAFTASQIPGIDGRRYPSELSGPFHRAGIPIEDEARLEEICRERSVERVVFAYSDVPHASVMHLASRALAVGADFEVLGPDRTMLDSALPVIAVSAVRTGCGKSQIARWIAARLRARGLRVAALRHPMPYGDLAAQRCQRFATREDLRAAECTIEEREEYEPYVEAGCVIFAGVDYAEILTAAEAEADVIVWDGGNNDFPFVRPDLHIVLVDALRPGHETSYWPGEVNLRSADIVVIAKADAADAADIEAIEHNVTRINPDATIIRAGSPVTLDEPGRVRGKRVIVVDDGPTLTHGGMAYGAGYAAALAAGVAEIIDPRPFATPDIAAVYKAFPHLGAVLPALGYSEAQKSALAATINASGADLVVAGTPIDLAQDIPLGLPIVRARYRYADIGKPTLWDAVTAFLQDRGFMGSVRLNRLEPGRRDP